MSATVAAPCDTQRQRAHAEGLGGQIAIDTDHQSNRDGRGKPQQIIKGQRHNRKPCPFHGATTFNLSSAPRFPRPAHGTFPSHRLLTPVSDGGSEAGTRPDLCGYEQNFALFAAVMVVIAFALRRVEQTAASAAH